MSNESTSENKQLLSLAWDCIKVGLLAIVVIGVLGFGANSIGLIQMKIFAPAAESVRRDTFEQSRAFRQGSINDLDAFIRDYTKAEADGNKPSMDILGGAILRKARDLDPDIIPSDMQRIISKIKRERGEN